MKKIFYIAIASLAILSCKKESKNYVTLTGVIANKNAKTVVVSNPQFKFNRTINLNEDGSFKDTMNVKTGYYKFFDGKEFTAMYLKNGAEINVAIDASNFSESVTYTGKGAMESSFLATSALLEKGFFKDKGLLELPKQEFDSKMNTYVTSFKARLKENKLDSTFTKGQEDNINRVAQYFQKLHANKLYLKTKLAKGSPSPKFVNYENFKGGTTSLDDLKGKYVYIDLWATWCNPCKQEIPFLQKIEKKYHKKNIAFVSISVDAERDYETWKKMVAEKELSGIQLYSKRDKSFSGAYRVNSIPRFILIDPQGNIIDANAPRPSSSKLVTLFDSLNI